MCIAIYSEIGVEIPSKEILSRSFKANPDGCGFAYSYNGSVYVRKGFFNFEDFYTQIDDCNKRFGLKNQGVLIHFRIATHGNVDSGNCHPFPITEKEEKLKNKNCKCKYAAIHNGICECTSSKNKNEPLSDTALFVRDYLTKIAKFDNWFYSLCTLELVEKLIDSKMAILANNGKIIATSGFHKGEDGNFYSNHSYEEPSFSFYDYGFWNSYYYDTSSEYEMLEAEIPLMRLNSGEAIQYNNGTVEDYIKDYHQTFPTFVTKEGDVYMFGEEYEIDDIVLMEDLNYIGEGKIIDLQMPISENGIRFKEFRCDVVGIM